WIMLVTFVLLLALWILGSTLKIDATSAAFFGIALLLVTKVLTWSDMAKNSGAWSTLIFFSVLVAMAEHLNTLGVIGWIGTSVSNLVGGLPWAVAFVILFLVYFYVHYLFASNGSCWSPLCFCWRCGFSAQPSRLMRPQQPSSVS
ncbi:hypothetical protein EKL28_16680, partial [Staphylococcus aureus]